MIKMKTLLSEQDAQQDAMQDQNMQLIEVLKQYENIFETARNQVNQLQYTFDSEDILRTNALVLLTAYVEYIQDTIKTQIAYGETQSADDIMMDATGGIKTYVNNNLEY